MLRIISRYIVKEALGFALISLFVFTGILLTLKMLKFAGLIINKGVEFGQIWLVFVSIVPSFLEIALPLSALLGVMLAFGRLSGDSEVVVFRASGISMKELLFPTIIFGILAAVLCLVVTLHLSPWGNKHLSKTLFEIAKSRSTVGLEPGVFNKLGILSLYAESINHQSGEIANVLIDDKRNQDLRKIILAEKGAILSDEARQRILVSLRDGVIHEQIEGKYIMTGFASNTIVLDADELYDPTLQKNRGTLPRELYLTEIRSELDRFRALAKTASSEPIPQEGVVSHPSTAAIVPPLSPAQIEKKRIQLRVEFSRRFSMPCAAFLLAILGLPLGIHHPRTQKTWGTSLAATLGMLVFVSYYALFSLGGALAETGLLNPYISTWIPNVLVLCMAYFLIRKMAQDDWQSVADGLEAFVARLLTKRHS